MVLQFCLFVGGKKWNISFIMFFYFQAFKIRKLDFLLRKHIYALILIIHFKISVTLNFGNSIRSRNSNIFPVNRSKSLV